MNLGIIQSYNKESFYKVKEYGLSFIELCLNSDQDYNNFLAIKEEVRSWIQETGVGIGSIGVWGARRIKEDGSFDEATLEKELALIDAAGDIGCSSYVTGCNYNSERSYLQNCLDAVAYFEKLVERGKEKSVKICVYNCDWNNFVYNDMAWTVIMGHLPDLYIKFDCSHSIHRGEDYINLANKWGNRFGHIHIKGTLRISGKTIDNPPPGLDSTDWKMFFSVLYNVGYQYNLSIEPHSAVWRDELGEKGILYSIEYIKKMVL